MESFLRLPAVKARTGLSRTTIYERIARGEFPNKVKLGTRASGWLASEIDAWVSARIAASRPADASADGGPTAQTVRA